jgi:hypothetical protein
MYVCVYVYIYVYIYNICASKTTRSGSRGLYSGLERRELKGGASRRIWNGRLGLR